MIRNSKSTLSSYSGVKTSPLMASVKNSDGTDSTISKQASNGLLILFQSNNTAVFADVGSNPKLIGTNLNRPLNATKTVPSGTAQSKLFEGYYQTKYIVNITSGTVSDYIYILIKLYINIYIYNRFLQKFHVILRMIHFIN